MMMRKTDVRERAYQLSAKHRRMGELAGQAGLEMRNIVPTGRRTSVRLEPEIWNSLEEIAEREQMTLNQICSLVDQRRGESSLTSSIRIFVLSYFRAAAKIVFLQ